MYTKYAFSVLDETITLLLYTYWNTLGDVLSQTAVIFCGCFSYTKPTKHASYTDALKQKICFLYRSAPMTSSMKCNDSAQHMAKIDQQYSYLRSINSAFLSSHHTSGVCNYFIRWRIEVFRAAGFYAPAGSIHRAWWDQSAANAGRTAWQMSFSFYGLLNTCRSFGTDGMYIFYSIPKSTGTTGVTNN